MGKFLLPLLFSCLANAAAPSVEGLSVLSGDRVTVSSKGKNGMVVVFLSAVCPCSDSHVVELKRLHKEFPNFNFVAVHSNSDEGKTLTKSYFKSASLPFPVIRDTGAKIADVFKAYKTPHAYVVAGDGNLLYQGGMSDSSDFERSERKFLREALENLSKGIDVKTPSARTLGCTIARGGANDW